MEDKFYHQSMTYALSAAREAGQLLKDSKKDLNIIKSQSGRDIKILADRG